MLCDLVICSCIVPAMPITVKDIISEGGTLEIRCPQCRKVVQRAGVKLLSALPQDVPCRRLQRILCCTRCKMSGEMRITFPDDEIQREKARRALPLHSSFEGSGH